MRVAAVLEGLGQQVHEGGGQQRAGSQAQEVLGVEGASGVTLATHTQADQEGGHPDAADAGAEGGDKSGDQGHAGWDLNNRARTAHEAWSLRRPARPARPPRRKR